MKRIARAFVFAWQGLAHAWRSQPNFRVEVAIGLLALLACWWLAVDWLPVLLLTALVLGLELINTAVEALCDLVSPEPNPHVKAAKDAAAAAVLLAAAVSFVVGLLLFGPPLIEKIRAYGKIS